MAKIPGNLGDFENEKFVLDENDNVAVRVLPVQNQETEAVNVTLDEEYRLMHLNLLRSANQTLLEIRELLSAIASE